MTEEELSSPGWLEEGRCGGGGWVSAGAWPFLDSGSSSSLGRAFWMPEVVRGMLGNKGRVTMGAYHVLVRKAWA